MALSDIGGTPTREAMAMVGDMLMGGQAHSRPAIAPPPTYSSDAA